MDKAINPQPPCDAFSYWNYLRGFPRYLEMAIQQLDPLRRANTYRCKMVCIPEPGDSTFLPAYSQYQYQFRVAPGSYIWAVAQTGAVDLLVQIRTSCNEDPLQKDFINYIGTPNVNPIAILPQPVCVVGEGLVDITLASRTGAATPANSQVVIFVAEAPDYNAELMPGVSAPLQ